MSDSRSKRTSSSPTKKREEPPRSKEREKEKEEASPSRRRKEESSSPSKRASSDKDRDRDRERTKDKDRERERTKDKEREREKDDRDKSRRDREKDSDKVREKDTTKKRSSRDREKEKDTDKWLEQELAKAKGKSKTDGKERQSRSPSKQESKELPKESKSSSKSKAKPKKESEDEEEGYDDDFEEYDDDFEPEEKEEDTKEKEKEKEKEQEQEKEKEKEKTKEEEREKKKEPSPKERGSKIRSYRTIGSDDELEEDIEDTNELRMSASNSMERGYSFPSSSSSSSSSFPSSSSPTRSTSPTLMAVRAAIDAENAAATPSSQFRGVSTATATARGRKVMDVRASIAQQEAMRRMARARDLSKLITFESVVVDILDMPPLDEYGKYIRYFGRSDASQQSTQTNDADDKCNKDVQTNPPQSKSRGVQVPGEGEPDEDELKNDTIQPLDTLRLGKFLNAAVSVVENLLDENVGDVLSKKFTAEESEWSSSYVSMKHPLVANRIALQAVFSQFLPHHVVVMYSPVGPKSKANDGKLLDSVENIGLLCMWNLDNPDIPSAVLVTYLTPNAICVPSRNTVVAGTVEGSILVWDLREPPSMHKFQLHNAPDSTATLPPFRFPTYSTDGLKEAHHHPVIRIHRIGTSSYFSASSSSYNKKESDIPTTDSKSNNDPLDLLPIYTDEDSGSAFKIASIDESGCINVWVIVELDIMDSTSATSDMDLHVSIGGRVRMVHTTRQVTGANRAFDLALHPLDPSRVLVACDNGKLIHGARLLGTKLGMYPQIYTVRPHAVDVLAVAGHPHSDYSELLLAGCADGSVLLLHIRNQSPLFSWDVKSKCTGVMWSPTRNSVFYVTTKHELLIFDLAAMLEGPIVSHSFNHSSPSSFSSINSVNNPSMAVSERLLALLDGSGSVQVHRVKDKYSVPMKEVDSTDLLQKIVYKDNK